ncbi:hypothetical protein M569_08904, partial [Genlisea aurea]
MASRQQLMDSLTGHISLYHSRIPTQDRSPVQAVSSRGAILRWFSSLSANQRRAHLTVLDPEFVAILLQMNENIQSRGLGRFIILPDLPQSNSTLPTLCFCKSDGLLARISEFDSSKLKIRHSLQFFCSKEGELGRKGNSFPYLDVMSVTDCLVKDANDFVEVMDKITNGEFLRACDEADIAGDWVELKWLKAKGYYTMEEFVANRLEVALRLAFLNCNSGKKKGVKLKEKLSMAGVAANLFWRKKGCVDWWEKLDVTSKRNVYNVFLGKASSSLPSYIVEQFGFLFEDDIWSYPDKDRRQKRCNLPSSGKKGLDIFKGINPRTKCAASSSEVSRVPFSLHCIFHSLYILQNVASLLSTTQVGGFDSEKLFFSSLDSINTVPDIVHRKLREMLLVISLDCTKLDLLGEEDLKPSTKKLNEKKIAPVRKKKGKNGNKKVILITGPCPDNAKQTKVFLCLTILTFSKGNKILNIPSEVFGAAMNFDDKLPKKDLETVKGVNEEKSRGLPRKSRKDKKKVKCTVSHTSDVGDCQSAGASSSLSSSLQVAPVVSNLTLESSCVENTSESRIEIIEDRANDGHSTEPVGSQNTGNANSICPETLSDDSFKSEPDSCSTTVKPLDKCNDSNSSKSIGRRNASGSYTKQMKDGELEGRTLLIQEQATSHKVLRAGVNVNLPAYVSYEWPAIPPIHPSTNPHLPPAADRLHLDIGHNLQSHFHRSFLQNLHVRKSGIQNAYNGIIRPVPLTVDWPPSMHGIDRYVAPFTCNYDSEFISRRQSSFQHVACGSVASEEDERVASGEILGDMAGSQELADELENHWMPEEELDSHVVGMMDYNQHFGGGVMYWNPSDFPVSGFSRPPSLCSDDSSWAWREADMNRAVDDMVTFSSSYSGLTSPSAASFCSPFDPLGSGSLGYVMPGSEISSKILHSSNKMVEGSSEESIGGSTSSVCDGEVTTIDTLPYPILRPIIIPNMSREKSRSEFRHSYDRKSPCVPPNRREQPRIKRPPSPVVLCVPSAPRPPPPSPVGDPRKHRGFPTVRSGSSSPRHWGVKSWFHDGVNSEDACVPPMEGSEVVWPSWRNKAISARQLTQPLAGKLLQERLVVISQLARDQEHTVIPIRCYYLSDFPFLFQPDVKLPLQPPETHGRVTSRVSSTLIRGILHDEIISFSMKVAAENLIRKPYINWAVKRVARSLQVLWPRSRTNVFGSNATGLALPSSDVDLVVCLPPVRNLEPIKEAGILEGRNGIKETCLQIPIIMLVVEVPHDVISAVSSFETTDGFKSVRLDISFKSPTHSGLQTTGLVKDLTEQLPALTPLALVLKQFLADRGLDQSYSGGLNSYCLILLITRFLQHEHHHGRPIHQARIRLARRFVSYGSLLMDFLYFFGNVFDPRQMRISVQGSGLYLNRERGCSIDPLCIDDPLLLANNVGRNCFRIHQCIKVYGQ